MATILPSCTCMPFLLVSVQTFAQGLAQVLYSLSIIELAQPGQEATTYELVVSVGNAALLLNGIVSTQLLTPMRSVSCDDDDDGCDSHTVDVSSRQSFFDSHGPERFTSYTLVLTGLSTVAVLVFARFLPRSKEECHAWKRRGEELGTSTLRGRVTLAMVVVTILVRGTFDTFVALLHILREES